ncbi:MAG TPA: GNAT family N-acetyltransferase [Thermoplasmata archaeon]|nr:GNAT family N-acetyltransferase [Thermoplasmata archaeon]
MVLRALRWADFEALVDIYWALYDEREEDSSVGIHLFAERPTRDGEVEWFSSLFQKVLRGETIFVVAEEDGRAVGSCAIGSASPGGLPSETSHVGVLGILIDRNYRGRGIGTALLVKALDEARGRFDRVRLGVFASNDRARRLYERVGFRLTGRLVGEVKRGDRYIDEDLMTLDLRSWVPPLLPPSG